MAGVRMVGLTNGIATGIYSDVPFGTGIEIEECDLKFDKMKSVVRFSDSILKLAGRNDPCPCGSGRKYKKCHLGKNMSSVGIRTKNSKSVITDALVVSAGDGIDLDNDESVIVRPKIYAGVDPSAMSLAISLGLPEQTPEVLINEAIEKFSKSKDLSVLESSKLKKWLSANEFDMAGWASVALSIADMAIK
jgi:hypothetical protein